MPFAVLMTLPTDGGLTVGRFSLSGPKDLKDRITHGLHHAHQIWIKWDGQDAGITTASPINPCEVHALLNVIEASGWKLTHATKWRYIFEKV
jgi:hypothetical protein